MSPCTGRFLKEYPHAPFDEIREQILNDDTLIIDTDKRYKSMLKYRLENWKSTTHRPKKKNIKQPIRAEILPEWFEDIENEAKPLAKDTDKEKALKVTLEHLK